jgi:peptidyl-tRNA hydrolase, PTH1 family
VKLLVGLGNPGAQYSGTRHNIGFDVLDYLASAPGVPGFRKKFEGQLTELPGQAEPVLLLKPETFMNLSGRSVRAAMDFYKLPVESLLVVSDDFNLPLGKLRVRAGGSAGGQNGLKDVQRALGTDQYARLRVGVGQPGPGEAVDFVLSKFRPAEKRQAEDAVATAAAACLIWLNRGLMACMNAANGPPESEKKPKKPKPADPAAAKETKAD